jgi:uncharacterized protein YjbI with pentapeptide repeats
LSSADLTGADIRGTDFSHTALTGAILTGTWRSRDTDLSDVDLNGVVCDTNLGRENLRGKLPSRVFIAGYRRLVAAMGWSIAIGLAALFGGGIGAICGQLIGRIMGRHDLEGFTALAGAALGVGWVMRSFVYHLRHEAARRSSPDAAGRQ